MKENVLWKGTFDFTVFDENKVRKQGFLQDEESFFYALKHGLLPVKRKIKSENAVTNYTRQQIVAILTGASSTIVFPTQMQLGTGSGSPSASDTDLWSPATNTLKQCSSIQPYLTYYAQYICTWLSSDNIQGSYSEIGIKDTSGKLWNHSALTSTITVATGEALTAQLMVQILSN